MASIVGIVLIRPYNDGGSNNTPRRNSCCSGNWRPKGLETKRNLFHFALKWFLCGSCRHPNCGLRLFEWAWHVGNFSSSPFLGFGMANLKFNGLKEVIELGMPSTSISDNSNVFSSSGGLLAKQNNVNNNLLSSNYPLRPQIEQIFDQVA